MLSNELTEWHVSWHGLFTLFLPSLVVLPIDSSAYCQWGASTGSRPTLPAQHSLLPGDSQPVGVSVVTNISLPAQLPSSEHGPIVFIDPRQAGRTTLDPNPTTLVVVGWHWTPAPAGHSFNKQNNNKQKGWNVQNYEIRRVLFCWTEPCYWS